MNAGNAKPRSARAPGVTIIIPNWNTRILLRDCLLSLLTETDYANMSVVVVDNGSVDGSTEMVEQEFVWAKVIVNNVNLGFARACNQGIKYATERSADYLLLLNSDTKIVDSRWLRTMVEVAESDPSIGLVGCRLVTPNGCDQQHLQIRRTTSVDFVIGAAFLIRRKVIDTIGLLDERFGLGYGEEIDFCFRARGAGFLVVYTPDATVMHVGGASSMLQDRRRISRLRWKNEMRLRLLNRSLEELPIVVLREDLVERVDGIPTRLRLRHDWVNTMCSLLIGFVDNLKAMPEILAKRRNRLAKQWY